MSVNHSVGFLITAYHKPLQLVRLINCIGHLMGYDNIFVHIDKKSNIDPQWVRHQTSSEVTLWKSFDVYWGGWSQLESICQLIASAMKYKQYNHLCLLSGQDMPIVTSEKLIDTLSLNADKSLIDIIEMPFEGWSYNKGMGRVEWLWFMDYVSRVRGVHRFHQMSHALYKRLNIRRKEAKGIKFWGGSDWWILPGYVAEFCAVTLAINEKYRKCFKYSFIPTEMAFQTIIMNSEFSSTVVNNNYRLVIWPKDGTGHPKILTKDHINEIRDSGCLFGRKFDMDVCEESFSFFEKAFDD